MGPEGAHELGDDGQHGGLQELRVEGVDPVLQRADGQRHQRLVAAQRAHQRRHQPPQHRQNLRQPATKILPQFPCLQHVIFRSGRPMSMSCICGIASFRAQLKNLNAMETFHRQVRNIHLVTVAGCSCSVMSRKAANTVAANEWGTDYQIGDQSSGQSRRLLRLQRWQG